MVSIGQINRVGVSNLYVLAHLGYGHAPWRRETTKPGLCRYADQLVVGCDNDLCVFDEGVFIGCKCTQNGKPGTSSAAFVSATAALKSPSLVDASTKGFYLSSVAPTVDSGAIRIQSVSTNRNIFLIFSPLWMHSVGCNCPLPH